MSEANSRPTPDVLDEATGALRDAPTPAGPSAELTAATVTAIQNRLAASEPGELSRQRRRRIMRIVGFGSAVAAAVAIGIVFCSPGRSQAGMFDRAMGNAGKANSFRAVVVAEAGPGMKFEMKMYGEGDRFRTEMDLGKELGGFAIVIDGTRKKGLQLNPAAKTAKWLDLSKPDPRGEAAAKDAAGLASLFAGLKGKKVEELPGQTVDGRRLKVFAVKGHKLAGAKGEADVTVWIDPKTELPAKARIEMSTPDVKGVVSEMTVLGWNEDLDDRLFELIIPEGYKLLAEPETAEKK
jgi:hypothetical protein